MEKNLESGNLVVEDQLFRKHGLMNKLSSTGKITDVFRTVTVTGEQQRQMIFAAVADVCEKANVSEPLHITVWMPEGEALAKRTFNPKLGIEGGLSVLGTSGILEPMSEQALIDTIRTEMKMHLADGEQTLLITPGNYGQDFLHETLKIELKS